MKRIAFIGIALTTVTSLACTVDDPLTPTNSGETLTDETAPPTFLISVLPQGGSVGVGITDTIGIEFNHPMRSEMLPYVSLHVGDVTGEEVLGTRFWSPDSTMLLFAPATPLMPNTQYTIHVGGGMTDSNGDPVECGAALHEQGEWATRERMGMGDAGGNGMGGGMGGGMNGEDHTGPGWMHPDNGTYGMIFTFTTE